MRSKEEILVDAKKRIEHLEDFGKHGMLKENLRVDLELLKELVALVKLGNQYECVRDIAIEQLHELGIGFGAKVDHIKETLERTQWISCSERLPEEPKENQIFEEKPLELYLVSVKNADYPFRAFWNGRIFTDGFGKVDVIAWQPLPEPYKGE